MGAVLTLEHLSKELEIAERLSRLKERALKQLMFVRGVNEAASRIGRDGKGKDGAVGYFVWLAAVQRRCCTLGSAVVSFLCEALLYSVIFVRSVFCWKKLAYF